MKRTYPPPAATYADPVLISEIFAAIAAGEETLVDRAFMEMPDLFQQRQFDYNRSVASSLAATADGKAWVLFGVTGSLDTSVEAAYSPFESQALKFRIETVLAEFGFRAIVGDALIHSGFCEVMMDAEWSQIAKSLASGNGVPEITGEVVSSEDRPTMVLPVLVQLPAGESWLAGPADAFEALSQFACTVVLPHLSASPIAFRLDSAKLPREIACSMERSRMSRRLVPLLLERGLTAEKMAGLSAMVMSSAGDQLETEGEFHTVCVLIQDNFNGVARLDLTYEATPRMLMSTYRVLSLLGFNAQVLTAGSTQPVTTATQNLVAQLLDDARAA